MAKSVPISDYDAQQLLNAAHVAGQAAVESAKIQPMIVQERACALDDGSPVVQEWNVPDGPCGFAWVQIKPSRGGIASYMKKNHVGRYSEWERAHVVSISSYGQSMQKKAAYASAYAKVLREAGIDAYSRSRMD